MQKRDVMYTQHAAKPNYHHSTINLLRGQYTEAVANFLDNEAA